MDLSLFTTRKELQEPLRSLLWEKRNIFKGVGVIKNMSHKIKLIEGSEPVFLPLRRRTPAKQESERK